MKINITVLLFKPMASWNSVLSFRWKVCIALWLPFKVSWCLKWSCIWNRKFFWRRVIVKDTTENKQQEAFLSLWISSYLESVLTFNNVLVIFLHPQRSDGFIGVDNNDFYSLKHTVNLNTWILLLRQILNIFIGQMCRWYK